MNNNTKTTVVIIDDYDMTRSLLKIILRGEQFDIIGEAADGQAGIDLCLKLKPDIVLLDVIMPIMNGIETLEHLRAKLPKTVVVMVTANDEQEIVDQAIEKGAAGYIVKPFNTASVIETMNHVKPKFVIRPPAKIS